MRRMLRLLPLLLLFASPAGAAVTYLGAGSLPGNAHDFSGLVGNLPDGTPHDLLGGIGSGIAYTGNGLRYLMTPDRGPSSGAVDYYDRAQEVDVAITPSG